MEVSQQSEESALLSARGVEGGKEREVVVKGEALEMLAEEFGLYTRAMETHQRFLSRAVTC